MPQKHNSTTQLFKLTTRQVNPITSLADGSDTNTVNQTHLRLTDFKRDMMESAEKRWLTIIRSLSKLPLCQYAKVHTFPKSCDCE